MHNLSAPPFAARQAAVALTIALLVGHGAAFADDNSAALNTPGATNAVTERMNKAAAYSTDARLGTLNSLYQKPLKTNLQQMTCLQKIMDIRFDGLSSFSFSGLLDSVVQAAIQALMQAACSYVDKAWDSSMGKLTEMTTVDMGQAGTAAIGVNGSTAGVQYSSAGASPYIATPLGSAMSKSNPSYGGFDSIAEAASSSWEKTKNFFK